MSRDTVRDALVHELGLRAEVVAVWLDGSLARDEGDAYSDIDLAVAVEDDRLDAFLGVLPAVIRTACDPVLVRGYGRLTTVVTADWERADLLVRPASEVHAGIAGPVTVLWDPRAQVTILDARDQADAVPDRLRNAVEEFIRCLGLLPIAAARGEWIGGYIATGQMTAMLTELMQLENGTHRVGGALRLGSRLTQEQQQAIASLPPLLPDPDSIVLVHTALAREFLPRARALAERMALDYPSRLEDAVRVHLRRHGVDLSQEP